MVAQRVAPSTTGFGGASPGSPDHAFDELLVDPAAIATNASPAGNVTGYLPAARRTAIDRRLAGISGSGGDAHVIRSGWRGECCGQRMSRSRRP